MSRRSLRHQWAIGALLILLAAAAAWPTVARGQAAGAGVQERLDELAKLSGDERQRFLEAQALKEGKVVMYAADDPNLIRAWNTEFKKKYPQIDAQFIRMTTREMLQRSGVIMGGLTEARRPRVISVSPSTLGIGTTDGKGRLNWVGEIDSFKWESGERTKLLAGYSMSLGDVYSRLALTEVSRLDQDDIGRLLIIALAIIGVLFLIIQVVAFSMGLALARSITGSVHELFAGTERVRRGDFAGRVSIKSRDQLGELSASFNSMTASIEDLLLQKAEKERMEQELRIARNIQMSLLPQGPPLMPGVSLTAHCEPAREGVGTTTTSCRSTITRSGFWSRMCPGRARRPRSTWRS